jgi:hypothetical protein
MSIFRIWFKLENQFFQFFGFGFGWVNGFFQHRLVRHQLVVRITNQNQKPPNSRLPISGGSSILGVALGDSSVLYVADGGSSILGVAVGGSQISATDFLAVFGFGCLS